MKEEIYLNKSPRLFPRKLSIHMSVYIPLQTCDHCKSMFRARVLTLTLCAESFLMSFKCLDALDCFQRHCREHPHHYLSLLLGVTSQKRNVPGSADTFMTQEL